WVTSKCSTRHATPAAWWTRRDAAAHDVGEVLERGRAEACRSARAARATHGGRSIVSRSAPLPRRHQRHAPRPGACGTGRDVHRTGSEHRRAPDPQGPAGVPGGAARRQRERARVRLAGSAVPRAADQERAAEDAEAGRRRLAFDELFDQQLVHARARALAKRSRAGIRFALKKELTTRLKEHLPFELTGDQRHAIREIADDMTAPLRMHRLLMGDVGTGKTVVALFAMLLAVENEYQAVIMAPTELLAEQHVATLTRLLAPLELKPDLLIGRLSAAEKAAGRERIATGASRLIFGTHALIQESVRFR